jgi:ElaB/YqjD/DUF883 family membrane-anchored ribosome-binding protein
MATLTAILTAADVIFKTHAKKGISIAFALGFIVGLLAC